MGDHQDGRPAAVDVEEQAHDAAGRFLVEVAGRLVGQDEGGLVEEGTGDGGSLLLAARKLVRQFVRLVLQSHGFQDVLDALGHGGFVFPARSLEREAEVVLYGTVHQQLEILEDDAQGAPEVWYLLSLQVCQVERADGSRSAKEGILPGQSADDGGFSASDLACQVNEFAGQDGQVEVLHHDDFPVGDVGGPKLDDWRCISAHKECFDAQI